MNACTAIVGINWGDEGKGRMVDLLSADYDVVVRYQGGNNAGHTVVNERGKFVMNLLPSGVLRPETANVLGPGIVIDLEHLWNEVRSLEEVELDGLLWGGGVVYDILLPYSLELGGEYDAIADSEWLLLCFPGIENHAASAIFAELSDLFLLEDAEGFAGVVFAVNIGWVEDVAQLLLVETVEFRVPRVKLGAEYRPPLRVEHERLALISQRLRPAFQRVGGVGKLKDSRHNEINIVLRVGRWGEGRNLGNHKKVKMHPSYLLSGTPVMRK